MNKIINNTCDYIKYLVHRCIVCVSPTIEINRCFKKTFGRKANLISPKSLIEKIYWMQLHCDTSDWTLFTDKYKVRDFIELKGFGKYLPKLYGVWYDPDEIDIDSLPDQFVLKTNNGCAQVVIVKNKNDIDWQSVNKNLQHWLKIPFGFSGYECHYLRIQPCVIAEELLSQNEELDTISPESMIDFKFWCFNGHVESCLVTYGRKKGNLYIDLYDTSWYRLLDNLKQFGGEVINPTVVIPRPKCLDKMIQIASNLSKGQPEMRVDMYLVNDEPVIGELTMSSGYGYFTKEYYDYLGGLVDESLLLKIK